MNTLNTKLQNLREYIGSLGSVAVAFSGGVDSSFLLKVAHDVLGKNAFAVSVVSQLMARSEKNAAEEFCKAYGIELLRVEFDALSIPQVRENPADRCYFCKEAIFMRIIDAAKQHGIACVADGSNTDDENDYRPGMKALAELNVISPLRKCELSKAEIRALSKELGLETWNAPSAACLASRIAYGEELTEKKLLLVDAAEDVLRNLSFGQCRVRVHGNLARLEVSEADFEKAISLRKTLFSELKKLGFFYITLDLGGYRVGSMNEELR